MRNKILLLLTIICMFMIPIKVDAIVERWDKKYITDEADLLDIETEDYIVKYSKFIEEQEDIKFYVVTVKELDDLTLEEYTDEVYEEYKLTSKGVLILVAKDTHKFRIQVGEDLSIIFPEETIDEYINKYMMPYFKNGEWQEGIKNGYSAMYKTICSAYSIDASEMDVYNGTAFLNKYKYTIISVIVLIGTLLAGVYANFLISIFKIRKKLDLFDMIILILSTAINIFLIWLLYVIVKKSIIIMLVAEGLVIYSSYSSYKETKEIKQTVKNKNEKKEKEIKIKQQMIREKQIRRQKIKQEKIRKQIEAKKQNNKKITNIKK